MREKILLIDGHSILNRAFYGLPDLTNSEGLHTNAIYGFLNILFKMMEEEKPDYLTVAFDLSAPTFRHKMYDAYKGTRKPMPQELRQQVPVMKDVLGAMGVPILSMEGYEADDLLGTIAKRSEAKGMDVTVLSGDRDLLQLATDHICIRIPKTKGGKTTIEDYFAKDVQEAYQLSPLQIIELKALMGDTADNIPGLPGVGEKTATKLLLEYGSVENAHAHAEEIKPNKAKNAFLEHYDLAVRIWQLSALTVRWSMTGKLPESMIYILRKPTNFLRNWNLKISFPDLKRPEIPARQKSILQPLRILQKQRNFLHWLKRKSGWDWNFWKKKE